MVDSQVHTDMRKVLTEQVDQLFRLHEQPKFGWTHEIKSIVPPKYVFAFSVNLLRDSEKGEVEGWHRKFAAQLWIKWSNLST
jgi:hypothetical protein